MNWGDVLPSNVAKRQAQWERRHRVRIALDAGADASEIASRLSVGRSRVFQLAKEADLEIQLRTASPVERHFAAHKSDHLVAAGARFYLDHAKVLGFES